MNSHSVNRALSGMALTTALAAGTACLRGPTAGGHVGYEYNTQFSKNPEVAAVHQSPHSLYVEGSIGYASHPLLAEGFVRGNFTPDQESEFNHSLSAGIKFGAFSYYVPRSYDKLSLFYACEVIVGHRWNFNDPNLGSPNLNQYILGLEGRSIAFSPMFPLLNTGILAGIGPEVKSLSVFVGTGF